MTESTTTRRPRLDTKTALAIVGACVGIAGAVLALLQYRSEQPNAHVTLSAASLVTPGLDVQRIPEELAEIEEEFGDVTAKYIMDLRDEALLLEDEADGFDDRLERFNAELQSVIKHFDVKHTGWTADDIQFDRGTITWPDGMTLSGAELGLLFPTDLVEEIRALDGAPDAEFLVRIRHEAQRLYDPDPTDMRRTQAVAARLRQVRTPIQDYILKKVRLVRVEATVENRSRMPTVLLCQALLRVYKNESEFADIFVRLDNPELLEGFNVRTLVFQSKALEAFSEEDRDFVMAAFEQEYECFLLIQDLHRNCWSAEGKFSEARFDASRRDLVTACNQRFPPE